MNLLSKVALAFIATSLFWSCKKADDKINLDFNNPVGAIFTDTFTVEASTIYTDSVISNSGYSNGYLMGIHTHPIFGEIMVSNYAQTFLNANALNFGANAEYKSVELIFENDYFFGDSDAPINILIYTLNDDLKEKQFYYTFNSSAIGENIGQISFDKNTYKDSMVVKLSDTYGSAIFNESGTLTLLNQTNFVSKFKGLAFLPQNGNGVFRMALSKTKVRLKYTLDGVQKHHDFSLNNAAIHYTKITSDRSNTIFANVEANKPIPAEELNNTAYIQSATKYSTRLSFPTLGKFLKENKIAIYRAEIEVKPQSGSLKQLSSIYSDERRKNDSLTYLRNISLKEEGEAIIIDVTDYLQFISTSSGIYKDFLLTSHQRAADIDDLIIENVKENIKLKIYYTEL